MKNITLFLMSVLLVFGLGLIGCNNSASSSVDSYFFQGDELKDIKIASRNVSRHHLDNPHLLSSQEIKGASLRDFKGVIHGGVARYSFGLGKPKIIVLTYLSFQDYNLFKGALNRINVDIDKMVLHKRNFIVIIDSGPGKWLSSTRSSWEYNQKKIFSKALISYKKRLDLNILASLNSKKNDQALNLIEQFGN